MSNFSSIPKTCVIHLRPLTENEHKRIVLASAITGLTQREFILLACETEIRARNLKDVIDAACNYTVIPDDLVDSAIQASKALSEAQLRSTEETTE